VVAETIVEQIDWIDLTNCPIEKPISRVSDLADKRPRKAARLRLLFVRSRAFARVRSSSAA
jgi:hypothetical protein